MIAASGLLGIVNVAALLHALQQTALTQRHDGSKQQVR
jgi:hypothetical protein